MSHPRARRLVPLVVIVGLAIAGLAYLLAANQAEAGQLVASGTVEATQLELGPEVGGRVTGVFVEEGQEVRAGEPLFRLDDALLVASLGRVEAAKASAEAQLEAASIGLQSAELQLEMTLTAARQQQAQAREGGWRADPAGDFDATSWYFTQAESMQAAEAELAAAHAAVEEAEANLAEVMAEPEAEALALAEARLAASQRAHASAVEIFERARRAREDGTLRDVAESAVDGAEADLEAAEEAMKAQLETETGERVRQVRAELAVAQARQDLAQNALSAERTGEFSLEVEAARLAVERARAQVDQAQRAVSAAQAELEQLELQRSKLSVAAPVDGTVLSRGVEVGEVVQPGGVVLSLARLEDLTITVFLPEDRYGRVSLGDRAVVQVDSYPNETFEAEVVRIAQQAEFTPRNVQTEEGRRTTVFAVELRVVDPAGKLKPGMPADVTFDLEEAGLD